MKVQVCCPLCGQLQDLTQLPDHIETEHGLTGELTLILNPVKPYSYIKAELTPVKEPAAEEPAAEVPAAEEPAA